MDSSEELRRSLLSLEYDNGIAPNVGFSRSVLYHLFDLDIIANCPSFEELLALWWTTQSTGPWNQPNRLTSR